MADAVIEGMARRERHIESSTEIDTDAPQYPNDGNHGDPMSELNNPPVTNDNDASPTIINTDESASAENVETLGNESN